MSVRVSSPISKILILTSYHPQGACRVRYRLRRRSRSRIRESQDRGNAMIWAVAIVGLLLVGWGAYREYFAESEETEGSILTNGLFISGVTFLADTSLYGMYRLLA